MQHRRAEVEFVGTVAPVQPDNRNIRLAQRGQQALQWRNRAASWRDVYADVPQPAVGMAKVILHINHDKRRAPYIQPDVPLAVSHRNGLWRNTLAHQINLLRRDMPLITRAGAQWNKIRLPRNHAVSLPVAPLRMRKSSSSNSTGSPPRISSAKPSFGVITVRVYSFDVPVLRIRCSLPGASNRASPFFSALSLPSQRAMPSPCST